MKNTNMRSSQELKLAVYEQDKDWSEDSIRSLKKILDELALNFCQKNRLSYASCKDRVNNLMGAVLIKGGGEIEEGGHFEEMVLEKIQDGMYQRQKIVNLGWERLEAKKNDFRIFVDLGISPSMVKEVEIELGEALVAWPEKTEKLLIEVEERNETLKRVEVLMFPEGFIGADGKKRELLPYQRAVFARGLILKYALEIGKIKGEIDPLFFDEKALRLLFDSHEKLGVVKIERLNRLASELVSKRLMLDNGKMFEDLGRQGWERIATCQKFSSGFENDPVRWQRIKNIFTGCLPIDPTLVGARFGVGSDKPTIWRSPEKVGLIMVASESDLLSAMWVAKQGAVSSKWGNEISHGLSAWKRYKSERKSLPKRITYLEERQKVINGEIGDREDPNDFKFFTLRVEKARAYAAERMLRYYEKVLSSEKKVREMLKIGRDGDPKLLLIYTRDSLESEYSQLYQRAVGNGVRDNVVKRTETLEQMKNLRQKIKEVRRLIEDGASLKEIGSKGYLASSPLLVGAVLPEELHYREVLGRKEKYLKDALDLVNAYRSASGGFYFEIPPKAKFGSLVQKLKKEPKFKGPLEKFGRVTKTGRLEYFLDKLEDNMNNPFVPWDICVDQKLNVLMELVKRRTNVACAILYYPSQALELERAREGVKAARSKRDLIELYEKKEAIESDLEFARERYAKLESDFVEEMSKLGFTMKS